MIEKITNQNQIARHKLAEKINEIIDTIYDMQLAISRLDPDSDWYDGNHVAETSAEFEEQRKWIGKLCWFWDDKKEDAITGILSDLETTEPQPFVKYGLYYYEHCEPVSEDLIYKGE